MAASNVIAEVREVKSIDDAAEARKVLLELKCKLNLQLFGLLSGKPKLDTCALHHAVIGGHASAVRVLIDAKADVDKRGIAAVPSS